MGSVRGVPELGRAGRARPSLAGVARAAAVLVLAVASCTAGERQPPPPRGVPERPNLILIVADDLPREACGFLPGSRNPFLTPSLSALAAEGVVLTELHSPSPVCTPSRYALLTGRYASRSRDPALRNVSEREGQTVVVFNTRIGASDDHLARRLRDAGYATGAVGKNHVFDVPGFALPDYLADPEDPEVRGLLLRNARALEDAFHAAGFDYAEALYFANVEGSSVAALSAHNQEWITDAALRFVDRSRESPFFLYVASTVPHGPAAPERSWRADARITPVGLLEVPPQVQAPRESIEPRLSAAGITRWNGPAVLWLDDAIAALVARLEAHGIADRTVIVFVADHGATCKGSLYRRGSRTVGLVWTAGGFAAGAQSAALASLTDLAPTILDWAGVEYDAADFDGASLAPVLRGEATRVRDSLYLELGYSRGIQKDGFKYIAVRHPEVVRSMSMRERAAVLAASNADLLLHGRPVPTTDPAAPFSHVFAIPGGHDVDQVAIRNQPSYFDPDQLFDLEADPNEQRNLAGDPAYAERLAALRDELARQVRALGDRFGEFGEAAP